jgi:hypothetical protein
VLGRQELANRHRDTLISRNDIPASDVALQFAGVTPTKTENAYRNAAETHNVGFYFQNQAGRLTSAYAQAYRDKDSAQLESLLDQWRQMQAQQPAIPARSHAVGDALPCAVHADAALAQHGERRAVHQRQPAQFVENLTSGQ